MTDRELFARLDDVTTLGVTLWGEGRGEPLDGRAGIAWVVTARRDDPRWPNTVKAVCLQPKQFSCWNPNSRDANTRSTRDTTERLILTGEADPVLRECLWLAQGVLDGFVRDPTHGANHYLTEDLYRHFTPRWATTMRVTVTIGAHVFLCG